MFKKELGISIYPEKVSEEKLNKYLEKCKNRNINKVFISFLYFVDKETLNLYIKTIKKLKKWDFI